MPKAPPDTSHTRTNSVMISCIESLSLALDANHVQGIDAISSCRLHSIGVYYFCRESTAPTTISGDHTSVKIEEDVSDPPSTVEAEAALEDEIASKEEDFVTTEDTSTAKDSKPATKSLLARLKSSKKGVKKALKKCKKVHAFSYLLFIVKYAL